MKGLKDFPTDEDYNSDPCYHEEFVKSQQEFRNKIMSFTKEAGDKNELAWLLSQIHEMRRLEDKTMRFFVDKGDEIPEWQQDEVFYCVEMYREMISEMKGIYEKRRMGTMTTPEELAKRIEEAQKEWSSFRKMLWALKEPTPTFEDKEYEEKYYHDLEKEYRRKGLW